VGVEVIDFVGLEAGLPERQLHCAGCAFAALVGLGDVVGIGGRTVAGEFGEDSRAAGAGVLLAFEDEDGGAFGEDEAVAAGVEGAGGAGRVVVGGRERFR